MRTNTASRLVTGLAALALSTWALAAAPANAAAPAGITRADVLSAAKAVRADTGDPMDLSDTTQRTLRKLALNRCSIDAAGGESIIGIFAVPVESVRSVDGLITSAIIYTPGVTINDAGVLRGCSFGALAATSAGTVLNGTSTLAGSRTITSRLSGDAFMTPVMIDATAGEDEQDAPLPTFSAVGESAHSTTTTTSKKVWTPKTAKQKKAAKKSYQKKFTAAKKAYATALKKACHDKVKRSEAKKAYAKKVSSAKRAYKRAIAKTPTVLRNTRTTTTKTPFSVTASYDLPADLRP